MQIASDAFAHGGEIPAQYTCQGEDLSPPLSWSAPPPGTESFALVMEDPDAPDPAHPRAKPFVHWILFGIPARVRALPEAVPEEDLPEGTAIGLNDWKRTRYGGPCPPIGRHRYFFRLFALDFVPALLAPTKAQLERAIRGHVLAKAELMGTYEKPGRAAVELTP